jgi:2-dehydro-3-deoxyphosphogluconate aldolase / (4S)-4-hydroxy-2-oxoglutarate aldolase
MTDVMQQIGALGVIPVIALNDASLAVALGEALLEGGLPCAEITFRTAAAQEAIEQMATRFPELLVGAGTVCSVPQAIQAANSGAKFIVSPGFDAGVVDWCLQNDMPIAPGVMTPTEVGMALSKGIKLLKFFPAGTAGGIPMLKAIAAPYGDAKFIPTGGINAANLADYLRLPMVHACGGSWLASKQLLANKDFESIKKLAGEAVAIAREARGKQP